MWQSRRTGESTRKGEGKASKSKDSSGSEGSSCLPSLISTSNIAPRSHRYPEDHAWEDEIKPDGKAQEASSQELRDMQRSYLGHEAKVAMDKMNLVETRRKPDLGSKTVAKIATETTAKSKKDSAQTLVDSVIISPVDDCFQRVQLTDTLTDHS